MLRVFLTGGYQKIRRINWIIGVFILGCVLLSCFTGYLLPWDQTAYWAITICINMFDYVPAGSFLKEILVGDSTISERTLQLFFILHITIIPIILTCLLIIHFWKIRKARGVILPVRSCNGKDKEGSMVDSNTNLFLREAVVSAVLTVFVLVLAFVFNAPLGAVANAGVSPNPAKAPWYFSGFQELQLHFHPVFSISIIPSLILFFLFFLPFIKWGTDHPGTWFISRKAKQATLFAVLCGLIITPALIVADEHFFDFRTFFPNMNAILSTGVIPFSMVFVLIFICYYGIKKVYALTHAEAFQTTAVFLIISFLILMIFNVFFRGQGMKLIFPGG
jgi:quinol-cytochrome oxidoreductase complex cytochrome b subunit